MKTLVIGANGQIGRLFCQRAVASTRAMVRYENVAHCIEAALASEASKGRVIDLLDGEVPIESLFDR